ncbi:MAG: low molecular weight protein-tyrosine-phosphatase [Bacteroidia bacterium]|nr:low molecular weight protein-tyrosine-phosphatase [Bacteroidia bacterium]
MVHILFVCLGNICRSPLAEGIMLHLIREAGLQDHITVDSCGTGDWHTGEKADVRSRQVAARHGIDLPSRARKLRRTDMTTATYLIPMDQSNLADITHMFPGETTAQIVLMRHFDPEAPDADVPDPYRGTMQDFEVVYDMLYRSCYQLLDYIRATHIA